MAILSSDQYSDYVSGLDHAEGLAWGMDGYIYAGSEAGEIYRIDPANPEARVFASSGGFLLGLALDSAHNIYACDVRHAVVQRITPEGRVTTYSTGSPDEPFILPNYPTFDREGNLYIADSGGWKDNNGKIYKIKPGGETQVWCRELAEFPNGLCVNADESHLFAAMSLDPPRTSRVAINPDGSAGRVEMVVELPRTVPDGLAFDTAGNLYISCYRPDIIYRYTPDGELQVLAEDFEGTAIAAPTNVAFCGKDLDMFISTNIGRWHLTRYDLDAIGIPLNYPDLP
jgi:gluconolactonase